MAPSSALLLGWSLLFLLLTTQAESSSGPSSEDLQVLQLVNDYRTKTAGLPALSSNNVAACVGQQIAQKFVNTPCNNETGADTPFGQSMNIPDYPDMLASCKVNLVNTTMGYIAVDCVPESAATSDYASIAAQNITETRLYQQKLNDTSFTSAGVGSDGIWFALVLATDSPDGNFAASNDAILQKRMQVPVLLAVLCVILGSLFGTSRW